MESSAIIYSRRQFVIGLVLTVILSADAVEMTSHYQVVAVGSTANMTCTIPHPVEWFFKSAILNNGSVTMYNGYRFGIAYFNDSNYAMNFSDVNNDILTTLTIWNTSTRDSGIYTCVNPENTSLKYAMHLIVLDSDPQCNVVGYIERDQITRISCSFGPLGAWNKVVQWTRDHKVIPHDTETRHKHTVTSVLTLQRNLSIPDNVSYVEMYHCQAYFTLDNMLSNADTNYTPDYAHICNVVVNWQPLFTKYYTDAPTGLVTYTVVNSTSVYNDSANTERESSTASTTKSFVYNSTIMIGLLAITGCMVTILIIVIIRLRVFNRRLAEERKKVQNLEEVVLKEMSKKEARPRGSQYFRSIISTVSPMIRTPKLSDNTCNDTYAEIGEPERPTKYHSDAILDITYAQVGLEDQSERFPNRNGTEPTKVFYSEVKKNRMDNEQAVQNESERFLNRNGKEPIRVFYSEVNKNRVDREQAVQNKVDLNPLVAYSQVHRKQQSSNVQNRADAEPPLEIYSEINKKCEDDEKDMQNQVECESSVTYSEINKNGVHDNGYASCDVNDDSCQPSYEYQDVTSCTTNRRGSFNAGEYSSIEDRM